MQRAAVIGAGAAGLCAARHLLARSDIFAPPVVFEGTGSVGGTWCYDEGGAKGYEEGGARIHDEGGARRAYQSSMYRDLRTNLPKEVMQFPDFPFPEHLNSFLSHQEVLTYLQCYCDTHNLQQHIRFHTMVEKVEPVVMATQSDHQTVWTVTSSDSIGRLKQETFDAVFVCTGHYSDPHIPIIPGINNFKGDVIHSHWYRSSDWFAGRSVLVVGGGASGMDISMELARGGAKVSLSHSGRSFNFPLPPQIKRFTLIQSVTEDGRVLFKDGSVGVADVLLLCTGYNFYFPFLDGADLHLEVKDHLVSPLYHFLLPPAFPSVFFIGLCRTICPFPHFDCQIRFALAVLAGSLTLPSRADMEDEVRRHHRQKAELGVQQRHLMVLADDQWEYCSALSRSAGFPPLPPVVRHLYEEVSRQRRLHPEQYRRVNYRLVSDTRWELREPRDEGASAS